MFIRRVLGTRNAVGLGAAPAATACVNRSGILVRCMASASPRLGQPGKFASKPKAVKLTKPKARDIRFLMRTLPAPISGRVRHMRETPLESWVHNIKNERVGMVSLERGVFGQPLRIDIANDVVRWQLAARRQGTAKGKNRVEVNGSNRKIRPQKGSGRARQGDGKAPHFVGGGAVFPPTPRSYFYPLPKEFRRKGIKIALSAKYAEGNLVILDSTEFNSHRTRDIKANAFNRWQQFKDNKRILVIHDELEMDPNFALATRALSNVSLLDVKETNTYDVIRADVVFVTSRALPTLHSRLMLRPSARSPTASRVKFLSAPLYLQPQIGVNSIATANREDFISSLDATDRKVHGNELIKIGENKHIEFVPLTASERDARIAIDSASPTRRTFRQIVPGPSGGTAIRLADVPEAVPVPVSKPVVVTGAPVRSFNWGIYRKFETAQKHRMDTRVAEHDKWMAITKQKMLTRSTLHPSALAGNAASVTAAATPTKQSKQSASA